MSNWDKLKNILCVRLDNMGDVLMSSPAISSVKETFKCSLTLLTSSMGGSVAAYIPAIDDVMVWDAPWVKGTGNTTPSEFSKMVDSIREKDFDGAIIFTVYSQNPLPTALMLTLAGIPNRLAYCRENPYGLLTQWLPEEEPYTFIRHQVRRDLELVKSIGAITRDETIRIRLPESQEKAVKEKLSHAGVDVREPWLILHPGVSEKKRQYPTDLWIQAGTQIARQMNCHLVITGAKAEKGLADDVCGGIGPMAHSVAGMLSLEEFISLIEIAPLLISVNTGSVHLAAAVQTKVIVLYALTNPQHTPWKSIGKILPYAVPESLQSKNEVLRFVQRRYFRDTISHVSPEEIAQSAFDLLILKKTPRVEELVMVETLTHHGTSNTLNFQEP
jgi:ADP-heptose:LPS heptosyltransferase